MNIGFLVCSNGMGHVRRVCLISKYLVENGMEVTIYAEKKKIDYFLDPIYKKKINLVDFNTNTNIENWMLGTSSNWLNNYPASIKSHELVISDNLIEILEIVPNSIIMASFFWHNTLKIPDKNSKKAEKLLLKYDPYIISTRKFTPGYINKLEKNIQIGLTIEADRIKKNNLKNSNLLNSILISSGSTKGYDKEISDFLLNDSKVFLKSISMKYIKVEKKFKNHESDQIKIFNFTTDEFKECSLAIIRPSMGVITECLASNVFIIPLYEEGNNEINFNAEKISKLFNVPVFNSVLGALDYLKKNKMLKSEIYYDFNGPPNLLEFLRRI